MRYGIPLEAAERALRMVAVSVLPGAPSVLLGAINLHGQAIAVIDFRRRLGLPPQVYGIHAYLLVARTARRRLAIAADDVLGVTEVEERSVTPRSALPGAGTVSGVAATSDGLLLIQNLDAFLSLDEERALDRALEART